MIEKEGGRDRKRERGREAKTKRNKKKEKEKGKKLIFKRLAVFVFILYFIF